MKIVASVASIPERTISLEKTVDSILPNVSTLHVYLNNYLIVPDFLENEKIIVARSQDYGDYGDAGKFFWANKIRDCIHFTCDDDIVYTKEYFQQMMTKLKKYKDKAVVSGCGSIIKIDSSKMNDYYKDRTSIHLYTECQTDIFVNIVGTGVMAYNTNFVDISISDFQYPNMADIWFAIKAKQQKLPLVRVHIKDMKLILLINNHISNTIYTNSINRTNSKMDTLKLQTDMIKYNYPWIIYNL